MAQSQRIFGHNRKHHLMFVFENKLTNVEKPTQGAFIT